MPIDDVVVLGKADGTSWCATVCEFFVHEGSPEFLLVQIHSVWGMFYECFCIQVPYPHRRFEWGYTCVHWGLSPLKRERRRPSVHGGTLESRLRLGQCMTEPYSSLGCPEVERGVFNYFRVTFAGVFAAAFVGAERSIRALRNAMTPSFGCFDMR